MPFEREERHAGVTKYPLRKMLRFRFDAITSFSSAPLQWATFLGFVCSRRSPSSRIPLTIVARYTNIYERGVPVDDRRRPAARRDPADHASGSSASTSGRIYDEVKHRPLYVVRERINVEEPAER